MASERESSVEWATENDDDDIDFEESTQELLEDGEDDEGTTTLYYDAEEGTLYAAQETDEIVEENDEADSQPAARQPAARAIQMSQADILRILRSAGFLTSGITTRSQTRGGNFQLQSLPDEDEEQEESDDDDSTQWWTGHRRRRRQTTFVGERYPKVPAEEGIKLMNSGLFGVNDRCDHSACGEPFSEEVQHKRRRLSRRLLDRELGVGSYGRNKALSNLATHELIPGEKADIIVNFNKRAYSGQFSEDGSFFFAASQDFTVKMYDTSNPYSWKYYKTLNYYGGQWTITDATLSPDNGLIAYSSIKSTVCLARTAQDANEEPNYLYFRDPTTSGARDRDGGHFGIWSLRFSGDGTEIVAGSSNESLYVYDLEAQRTILRIPGHTEDVNAVCFGDKMSPHILFSGSDDTTLKVWDRRSLNTLRPAGMFLGHTEGLTYIDSKGDGRYVISNGKDQTCKLWDLRKMISTDVAEKIDPQAYSSGYDYRFTDYNTSRHIPHEHDCSLVTFRGHKVTKTLIRCHFSPATSTNQRYVYSGSKDGKIYIWHLSGELKATIDVQKATQNSRPDSDRRYANQYHYEDSTGEWRTIIREASWHPSAPLIAATSWNGWDQGLGSVSTHAWNDGVDEDEVEHAVCDNDEGYGKQLGSAPMGTSLTPQLVQPPRYAARRGQSHMARRAATLRDRLGFSRGNDDDDDE